MSFKNFLAAGPKRPVASTIKGMKQFGAKSLSRSNGAYSRRLRASARDAAMLGVSALPLSKALVLAGDMIPTSKSSWPVAPVRTLMSGRRYGFPSPSVPMSGSQETASAPQILTKS